MKNPVALALIAALAITLSPLVARAQDQPPEVVTIAAMPEQRPDGLHLRTLFLVRDKATGRVVQPKNIESASLLLSDNADEATPALLSSPTTPIKIALLLDESGSMTKYIPSVRAAAKDAIAKAPDQAQFAIFRFSDISSRSQVSPDLGFTPKADSATINNFIDTQYDARPNAPTCLYNIALQATHYLAQNVAAGERRAIILFTDGKDERLDGTRCSDRSLDDVTREADPDSNSPTPIYTVGLCSEQSCGNVATDVLGRMAAQTLAIERHGTPDKLAGLFYDVMDDLSAQKLAEATIAPCEEKQATLLVRLVNGRDPIRGVFSLPGDHCYTPRASVNIDAPQTNEAENSYQFPITIKNASPLALSNLAVQVIDSNGTTAYTDTLSSAQAETQPHDQRSATIKVRARYMRVQGDYTLRVTGSTSDGVSFVGEAPPKGQPNVLGELPFKHTLQADVHISIASVRPNDGLTSLGVTVDIDHKNVIDPTTLSFLQYEAKFFQNGIVVESFGPTGVDLTKTITSFDVDIPLPAKLRPVGNPAEYKLELTLIAPPDPKRGLGPQSYKSAQQQFTLTPPPEKSFWERVGPVVTSPYTLWALLVVVLGCVGLYAYTRYRTQRVIPRPFNPSTIIGAPPPSVAAKLPHKRLEPPVSPSSGPSVPPPPRPQPAVPQRPILTEIYIPPEASETLIHDETEIATSERPVRVAIKVLQTVDPSQVRIQTLGLPCVIGRKDADLTISGDPKISRAHAALDIADGVFVITDRNSANGTVVADKLLAKGGSAPLLGRTVVKLGPNTVIEIELKP